MPVRPGASVPVARFARFRILKLNIHRVLPPLTEETTLTTRSDEARARAEANFRKEVRAKDGAKAMMEYQASSRALREKTERLRALRLAKEAADRERAG
jgi:hypothetical protein